MRVLHVLQSLNQNDGGPLRAVLDLSSRALAEGLDSEIIGFGPLAVPDNPLPPHLVHAIPTAFPYSYRYAPQLRAWLHQNLSRFDGVILHGMWLYPNWAISKACHRAGIPYICFPHGMLEPWAVFRQGIRKAIKKTVYWYVREREIVAGARAVFFTTRRELELATQTFRITAESLIVIPYGVAHTPPHSEEPANPQLKIGEGQKLALFLGRLHPGKNPHFLIEAWAAANPSSDWILVFAGPCVSAYKARLDQLVSRLGISERVRFVGSVYGADKTYLLNRASWFLLPSEHENFGISVLEAINALCPVAVSDQVFLSDEFPKCAEVLPLALDSWIDFIRNRMPSEELRKMQIENVNKTICAKFSIERVTREWAKAIEYAFTQSA